MAGPARSATGRCSCFRWRRRTASGRESPARKSSRRTPARRQPRRADLVVTGAPAPGDEGAPPTGTRDSDANSSPPTHSIVERLRSVHLSMVEAVLGGEGLGRVAELASEAAGGPVAIVVPRLGVAVAAPASSPAAAALPALRRYAADRVKDRPVEVPDTLLAEAPIATGDDVVGIVALVAGSSPAAAEAAEYLHLAAVASLTEVAVEE